MDNHQRRCEKLGQQHGSCDTYQRRVGYRPLHGPKCWGCPSIASKVITISAPQLTPVIGADSICLGTTTQLTHVSQSGAWSNFSTILGVVSSSGLYTSASISTDTVFYQHTSNGCPIQAKKAIKVVLPDTATIAGNTTVCKGQNLTLTPSISGGIWSSSNTAVATVSNSGLVTGADAGTAIVTYTVTNTLGCTAYSHRTIVVNAPQLIHIVGADSICRGTLFQFTHPVGAGMWTHHTPALGSINAGGMYVAMALGIDTIRYQYQSNGCPIQAKKPLKIVSLDSAAITGNAFICAGGVSVLSASVPGGTWSSGNNLVATVGASGQVSGVSGGNAAIQYTLTNPVGCSTSSVRISTVTEIIATTSLAGATLTAASNQSSATYQWVICNGSSYQPIPGATGTTHTATNSGQHAVIATSFGCSDTSACLTVTVTKVDGVVGNKRPVTAFASMGQLIIDTGTESAISLALFDARGRRIWETRPRSANIPVDVSAFAQGIYILHAYFRDQRVVIKVHIP